MTQKELLYIEDAIKHEDNIIAYLKDIANILDEDKLASFIEKQIKQHEGIHKILIKALEDEINE